MFRPAFVRKIEKVDNLYRYTCNFTSGSIINSRELVKSYTLMENEKTKKFLSENNIRLNVLNKVICVSKNRITTRYIIAKLTKKCRYRFYYGIAFSPSNYFKTKESILSKAVHIKDLEKVKLFYYGVYINDKDEAKLVRIYTSNKDSTLNRKLKYHISILNKLQSVVPEKVYKYMVTTMGMKATENGIVVSKFYHEYYGFTSAVFDFMDKRTSTCIDDFDELSEDPVGFLVTLYESTINAEDTGDEE